MSGKRRIVALVLSLRSIVQVLWERFLDDIGLHLFYFILTCAIKFSLTCEGDPRGI